MLRKIFQVLKKILLTCFLLYGYNLISLPLGVTIPINIITVSLISLLGMPALCSLIAIFLIVF